jgi:hypothetical protein
MAEPDTSLYRTLGELVAEVRELRRTIEANAAQVDRRLKDLEDDVSDIKAWKNQVRGGALVARWAWMLLGTGVGGTAVALILGLR